MKISKRLYARVPFLQASFLIVPLLTVLGMAGCSSVPTEPYGKVVEKTEGSFLGGNEVYRYRLENGLTLLVLEDHSSPTFAFQTWFNVGSADEVPGKTGLAHLFEHMMFKQTKTMKDGEFDQILEKAGSEGLNAFTSRDYTAYIQELPDPENNLELIARLEADRMANLLVNEKAFKTETEVVQNERRFRNENSPDGTIYQEIFTTAFREHPYRWPVIGYAEDLDSMTAEDALAFYRSHYSPDKATIVVVGDVNHKEVLHTIQKHYRTLERSDAPLPTRKPEPEQKQAKRKTIPLNIQTEKLMMGYHIPSVTHEDIPKLMVLRAILTGGKSSRLNRALVDTGVATSVGAYEMENKSPSLFLVTADLQQGKRATVAERVIRRELSSVAKNGVSPEEVKRAKNILNFQFYEGLQSDSQKARFLGQYEIIGGTYRLGLQIREAMQEVTPEDVQAVAKKYFKSKNMTVITGVAKK